MAGPYPTTLYTAQTERSYKLAQAPSHRSIQQNLKFARFPYTVVGTEASGEKINLGFLKTPTAYIVPKLSSVTCPSGAGAAMVMTLRKVDTAATATALTAAATQVAASEVSFAKPATTPTVAAVAETDYLEVLLGTVTTATAGVTVIFEIAYYAEAPF